MKTISKYISRGLLLTTALISVSCSGSSDRKEQLNSEAITVNTVVASLHSENGIVANGQVESEDIARLGTRMMGYVTSVRVKVGDKVRAGELLITISDDELKAKAAQVNAMIKEAEAANKIAKKDFDRFSELYAKKSVSAKEFENITLQYESVQAKLEMAQQMKKEVEANLSYSNITSPFAGVVTQLDIDNGALATPGMPLVTVERESDLVVTASVSESSISKINIGMKAVVTVKSANLTFETIIREKSTSSLGTGGQYLLKVTIPNEIKSQLYSGMYANVLIPTAIRGKENSNLMIPKGAIIDREGLNGVYVVSEDNKAMLRWVRIGKEYGDQIEILSGINPEDQVVVKSNGRLINGSKVKTENK
ncbi:MAG: efflux RND transporter periplasmic adaptor subunit [Bacteroidales bacterium]